jgi:transcriptional regulator with XRE-family HTH domain
MDNEDNPFGMVMMFLRSRAGINQKVLGSCLFMNAPSVSKYETGKFKNIPFQLIKNLAATFDLKTSEVVVMMEEFDDIPLFYHERIISDAKWIKNKTPKQIYQTYPED